MKEQQHYSVIMPQNQFFKKFATEHQVGLDTKIEETYGTGSYYHKVMLKAGITQPFNQRFTKFINHANYYRKQNPHLFDSTKKTDESAVMQERLKNLTPISISPTKLLKSLSPEKLMSKIPERSAMADGHQTQEAIEAMDEADIRRLKATNCGKWYIKPDHFNKKLAPITDIK